MDTFTLMKMTEVHIELDRTKIIASKILLAIFTYSYISKSTFLHLVMMTLLYGNIFL